MEYTESAEKAILIGIRDGFTDFKWMEFEELVRAAGACEVGRVVQLREHPDPAYFIGSGKAEELAKEVAATGADLVIAMDTLSPVQVRNLSEITGVRVIDRTDLILDIFAQRAQTKEGKLQVELAQLKYILPRLGATQTGQYSRLGGGIGTRGPGETKLEVDRRRVRKRITDLQNELAEVVKNRNVQRHRREKQEIPTIALVGYTNAGKSALFNRLTDSAVPAVNRLFDTLDPVARRFPITPQQEVILLDTVGFISDLPHQLVAAFRATLEETVRAAFLLHVIDGSSPELWPQFNAVRQVLTELKIDEKTVIPVINKIDLIESPRAVERLAAEWSAFPVSARTGEGIDQLLNHLIGLLNARVRLCRFSLPYHAATALDLFHQKGKVLSADYGETGIRVVVEIDTAFIGKYQQYLDTNDAED